MDDNAIVFVDAPFTEHLIIPIIDLSDQLNTTEIDFVETLLNDMCEQITEVNYSLLASKYTVIPVAFGNETKVIEFMATYRTTHSELEFSGECQFDFALESLNQILQPEKDGGMLKPQLNGMPIIMLVLGSHHSKSIYSDAINKLKANYWFNFALKFAITFGNFDKSVIEDFVTSDEYIIKAEDIAADSNLSHIFNGKLLSPDENSGFTLMSNYSCTGGIVENSANTDEKFKLSVMDNIRKSLTCTGMDDLF